MVANITCPVCGQQCQQQSTTGSEMRCPSCFSIIPAQPTGSSPLLARSTDTTAGPPRAPVNRTILAQPEAMIRYTCPRCKSSLESPASFAGQKLNCPNCGQRMQIPQPSVPPSAPPINKTILAKEESVSTPSARTSQHSPPAVPPDPELTAELVEEALPARRHESCLECGIDITRRARVQTCPDCGSLFCSASCYRTHHNHAHARKKKKRSRPVECPYCDSTERPYARSQISQAGWIIFAVLLLVFFPLCWIGLLMTETEWRCRECNALLD
jgi:DNA-directed RNA polymerase subunit RPC12/RpoP